MGWAGFNCSIPHKVAVIEHLDGLADSARMIGAVNCAVTRDGRLIGENTDGQGFLSALRTIADPRGNRVLLLGAGGAARAIAVELHLAGAGAIMVVNRDPTRGREVADLVGGEFVRWERTLSVPENTDVLVNATPMSGPLDLDPATLRAGMVVADVIVNPPRTRLIKDAQQRGCTTLDGLGMLVNQGVISVRHWTGADADPAVMRTRVEELLGLLDPPR
jgi:shikimate dehydrogenase